MSIHFINLLRILIILLLCLYLSYLSFAQIGTGSIRGKITDPEGNPLPGITVTIKGPTIAPQSVVTDEIGIYRFFYLPPGVYSITAELHGFKTHAKKNILIKVGITKVYDLTMGITTIEEEITVHADEPEIEYKEEKSAEEEMPADVKKKINEEIEQLSIGQMVFNPPEEMTAYITERIELRISQNINEDLTQGLKGRGVPQAEQIPVSTVMTAKLSGDTFDIKLHGEKEQPVLPGDYAEWEWDVAPQKAGLRKLQLSVSASINVDNFGEKKKSFPVVEKVIHVKVNPERRLSGFLKKDLPWIVGLVGGLIAIVVGLIKIISTIKRKKQKVRKAGGDHDL